MANVPLIPYLWIIKATQSGLEAKYMNFIIFFKLGYSELLSLNCYEIMRKTLSKATIDDFTQKMYVNLCKHSLIRTRPTIVYSCAWYRNMMYISINISQVI